MKRRHPPQGRKLTVIARICGVLALVGACAAIFVSSGTAASNTTCGNSAGHMYACISVDYYTSGCNGVTHYAFTDEYLQAVRGNSGWWASGASVVAKSNGFACSGVWQTSASKSVIIRWIADTRRDMGELPEDLSEH